MPPTLCLLGATAVLFGLAACASPDPKLYTLIPTGPAVAPTTLPVPAPVVELHRVDIPGYADRPEIVRSAADYRVHLAQNERWSEPLGDLVQRVLTQDLARRLPGAVVYSDAGAVAAQATRIVSANLSRIDSDGAGQAVLDAQFSVSGPSGDTAITNSVHLTAPIGGPSTADYAAALSALTGQLADGIVAAVRAGPSS